MTPTLQIEYRPIDALLPYARNPRTHSPAQIAKIAASIVEFGWTQPILVDGGNGIIAKIPLSVGSRYSSYYEVNDNILDNLMDCSYIPFSWNFRLVDRLGNTINQIQDYSFTLRIIPDF